MNENPNKEGKGMDPIVRGALDILTRSEAKGKEAVGPVPLSVGLKVWYQKPGQPETGPCTILLIHGQWNVVQKENGGWSWVHRCLIRKVG